jgi:hypothetical protein
MEGTLFWGVTLTLAVLAACGLWFLRYGAADRMRQARPFARRTVLRAGAGFLAGLAILTSDLGMIEAGARMFVTAATACCALLVYASGVAAIASDDSSQMLVNLTGRALMLTDPQLAPFFTLPAPQEEPATQLPPVLPRTSYIVSEALGRAGAEAGRTDIFMVDATSATDFGANGVLVRKLVQAVPAQGSEAQASG